MNNGIYESRMEIQQLKERNKQLETDREQYEKESIEVITVLAEKVRCYEKAISAAYRVASAEGYCGVCDELTKVINAYNIDVWEEKG
ncbi:hypothetical protein [Pseudobacillus badius]|uniref:hypothetical protein n=1 Tax=Bacillus badius TaxID=1455 RepID=UPI0024A590BE|nr:hypothetical protein [Bacillus badius]GLY11362.1 hypothetical protein Bbad01_25780 [Bacillus badius]